MIDFKLNSLKKTKHQYGELPKGTPPWAHVPQLIITRVCPLFINLLLGPSNGILWRSNWPKPYPKFYGLEDGYD